MTIEQSLAAREISKLAAKGYSAQCAIAQAAKLVKSQGFGAEHAKQTAKKMAELLGVV